MLPFEDVSKASGESIIAGLWCRMQESRIVRTILGSPSNGDSSNPHNNGYHRPALIHDESQPSKNSDFYDKRALRHRLLANWKRQLEGVELDENSTVFSTELHRYDATNAGHRIRDSDN
jgi:hypothetical protein